MEKVTCFRDFFRFIVVLKLSMNVFQNSVVDLRYVTAERKRDLNGISKGKYLIRVETPILAIWLGRVTFSILH